MMWLLMTRYFAELSDAKWEGHKKNADNLSTAQRRILMDSVKDPPFPGQQLPMITMCASEHLNSLDADEVESHKDLEMAAEIFRGEFKDTLGLVAEASEMGKDLNVHELSILLELRRHFGEVIENTAKQEIKDAEGLKQLAAEIGKTLDDEGSATCLKLLRNPCTR